MKDHIRQNRYAEEECGGAVATQRLILEQESTDPPLKAPTGFRTGKGAASVNLREDEWKLRAARRVAAGEDAARIIGDRRRDAIATRQRNSFCRS